MGALLCAAVVWVVPAHSAWYLRLSEHHCEAVYQFQTGYVRLFENVDTRRFRSGVHSDIDSRGAMLEFGVHGSYAGTYNDFKWEWGSDDHAVDGYPDRNFVQGGPLRQFLRGNEMPDTLPFDARLFPDDGEGFFPVDMHVVMANGYGAASYLWTDFSLGDRLKRWGTAKEMSTDPGVRLPEVRLIFRWTTKDRAPSRFGDVQSIEVESVYEDVTHYLDIPLWRTSNAMNKLERCSEALRPES